MTVEYNIKITHPTQGPLLTETFVNPSQFKLFLKQIQGCIAMNDSLTFFNGVDFFIHIPHNILVESIIVANTKTLPYTLTDHVKSKIEALETK